MIDNHNDRQSFGSGTVWTKSRIARLVPTFLLVAILVWFTLWMSRTEFQQKALLRQYQASPNCISNPHILRNLSPCTRTAMQITNKSRTQDAKIHHLCLTLRLPDGETQEVSLPLVGRDLWDRATIGDTIIAKSWRGKIIVVSGYGCLSMTDDYPDTDKYINEFGLTVGIVGLLLMPFFIVKNWREPTSAINTAKDDPSEDK